MPPSARPTPSTPSSSSSWYFARFCSPQCRRALRARRGRLLAAGRPVYRRGRARDPASALFALLHPRHAPLRLPRHRRAVRRALHPGHGLPRDLSRAPTARWLSPAEVEKADRRTVIARRDRRGGQRRPLGEDEQVEEEHGRSQRASSRPMAPTPRAGSCSPTARPSATWNGPRPGSKAPGASPTACGAWSSRSCPGCRRARRPRPQELSAAAQARRVIHKTIAGVTEDIEQFRFNRAVARVHELANAHRGARGRGAGEARSGARR